MSLALTVEYLREVLDYNPETGIFTWRVARSGVKFGGVAGTLTLKGYCQIGLSAKLYLAHRLAWLYVNGSFPKSILDHVNGDRTDNRIANLRVCNNSTNQENRSLGGSGAIPYLGVSFHKKTRKFRALIKFQGVLKHLGLFPTALEAHHAYLTAKKTMHTFHGWQP